MDITKMHFRKMKSFKGQHNFWMELGGFARVAIADQSVMGRDGFMFQPQDADHGLLFVDFHTLAENKYKMKESHQYGSSGDYAVYGLPVIDANGKKYTTILIQSEYDWFMEQWGKPKKSEKEKSILEEQHI